MDETTNDGVIEPTAFLNNDLTTPESVVIEDPVLDLETDPVSETELTPRQALRAATRATKESLIAQAELVAMISPVHSAPAEMKALLEQWKNAGRTTKSEDAGLWARFNSAQDQLFTRLDLLRQQRQSEIAEAKREKESLIATAEDVAKRSDTRQAVEAMTSLMAQWKQIGQTGDDKTLWLRFKAAHDELYSRRDEERHKSVADQRSAAELKKSLIAKVKALVGAPDLRAANADLKSFQIRFREAGYAGRTNKSLADQFHQAQQDFFEWVRTEPTRRREAGEQGTYGRRARLAAQIEQVRADIARAEQALKTTDAGGAKKSHGKAITLTLGESGAYTSAAADALRLRILLNDLEDQVRLLDEKLGRS